MMGHCHWRELGSRTHGRKRTGTVSGRTSSGHLDRGTTVYVRAWYTQSVRAV